MNRTVHRIGIGLFAVLVCFHAGIVLAADVADDHPLNLAAAANLDFTDPVAGDGTGGWSDQGPTNDFREFDIHATQFGGVPFRIIDPAHNNGKAVLSFRQEKYFPNGLTTVTLDLPDGTSGRYLYLLHTSCWNGLSSGESMGAVTLTARDGSVHRVNVQAQRDVADWWNPGRLPNGVVVASKPNQSAIVGVYLSRFDLGSQVDAKSLTITTTQKALWIVVAATLTSRDIPLPESKGLTITAGDDWKPLPDTELTVKAGTALDCSAWIDHAPAGGRGRVIARPDGTLAFASQPDKPVRFFCCSGFPTGNPDEIDALADTIVRQGYNMVRLHFLDQFLAGQWEMWGKTLSPEGQAAFDQGLEAGHSFFNARNLDLMDRFVAALKKRGVYLYVDALTSGTGCYPANCWYKNNGVVDLKARLFYDPVARRHWHHSVKAILTHVNPYTGTSFATDPQVVAILGMNEPRLYIDQKEIADGVLPLWRAFLARRFATVAAYRDAWGHDASAVTDFDQVPLFTQTEMWHDRKRGIIADFLNQLEQDTSQWMENEVRSFGYQGMFTMYDWEHNLRLYPPRAGVDMLSMHGYFAHPNKGIQPGSKTSPGSALADTLNWWRGIASARIAGKPLAITEYGQVYWNRYRYEEGLSVGAYASFQDISVLAAHAWPVALKPAKIKPFAVGLDPVARAGQVVTGLIFMGRAVTVAPHRVDIPLSKDLALDHGEMAVSGDQSRIGLLTGLAVAVDGHTSSVPASLQLPLGDGAKTLDAAFYSTVVDTDGGTFAGAVAQLRTHGILPPDNRTDPNQKIYENETGQLLLDARHQQLTVHTPRLVGICLTKIDGPARAGELMVQNASVPASITVASRDGRTLDVSRRLLVVIATDARNSGERYDDADGVTLIQLGTPPVLWRTGRFSIDITRNSDAPALRAWSLAMDGTRRDELKVTGDATRIHLEIDTAAWPAGPSPFIELAEQ